MEGIVAGLTASLRSCPAPVCATRSSRWLSLWQERTSVNATRI